MEILRFYYGTSCGLLKAFLGMDSRQALAAVLGRFAVDGAGDCVVRVGPGLASADARLIALLATSRFARKSTRSIFASLILSSRAGAMHPKVRPPVKGATRWLLRGVLGADDR